MSRREQDEMEPGVSMVVGRHNHSGWALLMRKVGCDDEVEGKRR